MNWWERGPRQQAPRRLIFWALIFFPQCHWVYRAFEDVEELQRERGADEKEDSLFKPYPVENGSDHEEDKGTNGTGETWCCEVVCNSLLFCWDLKFYQCRSVSLISVRNFQSPIPLWFFRSCQLVSFQSAKCIWARLVLLGSFLPRVWIQIDCRLHVKNMWPCQKHYIKTLCSFYNALLFFSFGFWLGSYSPCQLKWLQQ